MRSCLSYSGNFVKVARKDARLNMIVLEENLVREEAMLWAWMGRTRSVWKFVYDRS